MQKEDITLLAQLLTGMKDAVDRLEEAHKKGDVEQLAAAKKEILSFQKQVVELI